MKNAFIVLFLLVSYVVFAAPTADVVIRELKKSYDSIHSFSGTISINLANKSFKGTILYKKPNKLRVNFSAPSQMDIISDGKSMWIFMKTKNTVIKQPLLPKKGDRTIYVSEVINPYEKYNREYIIVLEKTDDKFYYFTLKPKPDVFTTFSDAKLVVNKNGLIVSLSGLTASKDNLSISITYSSINQSVDNMEFSFSPPADAQVFVDIFQE